ncbi:DUF3885 domain-containing protein [Liquorilactobacillus cacaonum]|uniref:DUF3885 domain-containing protein n=1 Tax=Liquorilactobacillus cacaonum DSM 21116 TaxID=1423729 RepID=A0A0R2CLV2_9LACO|nr:hypothetical protein [Liquorilactobacillus cacaonum]KRM90932.1 hypothetical protein FC80_GL000927 [Liquorilactobacillus cacaonum DSM 21116]
MVDYISSKWKIPNLMYPNFFHLQRADIEFAKKENQFDINDNLNEKYFNTVLKEMEMFFNLYFPDNNDYNIVLQIIEPIDNDLKLIAQDFSLYDDKNVEKIADFSYVQSNVCFRRIHASKVHEQWFSTNKRDFDMHYLFKMIANQDFPNLKPQLMIRGEIYTFNLYFVNDKVIYSPYDDRGAELKFFDNVDYLNFIEKYPEYLHQSF